MRENTEIRQKQIKRAFLDLIAEHGLHNVSTRNLAQKIGLSEGAIFRHFKTKRDIVKAIMDDVEENLVGTLRNITLAPVEAEQKLFEYLCTNVKYLKKNQGVTILLFSEATHLGDKELKEKLNEILYQQKQFIIKIVKQGISERKWNDNVEPEDFATIYMGIPITFNIEFVLNKMALNSENFCKKMYAIILGALRK